MWPLDIELQHAGLGTWRNINHQSWQNKDKNGVIKCNNQDYPQQMLSGKSAFQKIFLVDEIEPPKMIVDMDILLIYQAKCAEAKNRKEVLVMAEEAETMPGSCQYSSLDNLLSGRNTHHYTDYF